MEPVIGLRWEMREIADSFAPFDDSDFNSNPITLKDFGGRDPFRYTENYCYHYKDLKFDGQTPLEFYNNNKPRRPYDPRFDGPCRPSINDELGMSTFIGVVTRKMMPSGFTTFDLCLAG